MESKRGIEEVTMIKLKNEGQKKAHLTKTSADSDKPTLVCHESAAPFIFDVPGLSLWLSNALGARSIENTSV
jgi:hypothetical protein